MYKHLVLHFSKPGNRSRTQISLERDEVAGALHLWPDDVPEERGALPVLDAVETGQRPRIETGVREDFPRKRTRTHRSSAIAADLRSSLWIKYAT